MSKFIIGRPVNGISLNGYEYVLTPDGEELLTFKTEVEARNFMYNYGASPEHFMSGALVIHELDDLGEVTWQ